MKLIISDNLSAKDWDQFVSSNAEDGGLLQSWNWGRFQEAFGRKIFRLAVLDGKEILATALIIKYKLPLGKSYLYLPRGPVLNFQSPVSSSEFVKEILDNLFAEIKKLAKIEKSIFVRLDPAWTSEEELIKLGCQSSGQVQPKSTLILDLNLSEAELLKNMKPKTRYNIKVAQKHGVEVKYSDGNANDFEAFWKMMVATATRDRIAAHSKRYYQEMLNTAGVRLALAWWQNKPICGAIMSDFGDTSAYHHGASDYEFRDKMGPYLLQWQMILDAKKSGKKSYDFFGADEKRWPGVTKFKAGFSPNTKFVQYIGAFDFPISKFWHGLYRISKIFYLKIIQSRKAMVILY